MKKRRIGVLLLSSALILSGVTFGVVSCGEGTQQTSKNPQITLALDVSEIYVGQTAKVTATVNGSAVADVQYSIVEGGEAIASVASDGTVTSANITSAIFIFFTNVSNTLLSVMFSSLISTLSSATSSSKTFPNLLSSFTSFLYVSNFCLPPYIDPEK